MFESLKYACFVGVTGVVLGGRTFTFADEETREAAQALASSFTQRIVRKHIEGELQRRNILPVTIESLASVFDETLETMSAAANM